MQMGEKNFGESFNIEIIYFSREYISGSIDQSATVLFVFSRTRSEKPRTDTIHTL